MAEKNKNQTAQERARLREIIGAQASARYCASPKCPTGQQPILNKDLYPVVRAYPRKQTVFYHRACASSN
ncbi:MAG: hypothetical protein IT307_09540 [Chloroflexi bacterium]|nr:hypothetical protein [Chloroflexota bacterium]